MEWSENQQFAPWMFRKASWEGAKQQTDQIIGLLSLRTGHRVLDMCCGPGRHSLELARRGCNVTGLDLVGTYIQQARKIAQAEGLAVEFVQSDMRTFRKLGQFDVTLNTVTSFGPFDNVEEDETSAQNMFDSLGPSGRLLMEIVGKEQIQRHLISSA